jgi:hypothetical protein
MAPPAAIEGTVRADLFRLLKAHGRTRSASYKALSPSYATILRALKKLMNSLFVRNVRCVLVDIGTKHLRAFAGE